MSNTSLLELPNEILESIFEVLSQQGHWDRRDVLSLRATSRRLHRVSESAFYHYERVLTTFNCNDLRHPLNARPQRLGYVQYLDVVGHIGHHGDVRHDPAMPECLTRFTKLKTLQVTTILGMGLSSLIWRSNMQKQLSTNDFSALEECLLRLTHSGSQPQRIDITQLLQAPKLIKLTLENADLKDYMAAPNVKHSTSLRELRLIRCETDTASLTAILEVPSRLMSFGFAVSQWTVPPLVHGGHLMLAQELGDLQGAITVLAGTQRGLNKLDMMFTCTTLFMSQAGNRSIDFRPLKAMKQLRLRLQTCDCRESLLSWFGLIPFNNLPEVEVIEIFTSRPIELDLVGRIQNVDWLRYNCLGLPQSLRELHFSTCEDPERPLKDGQHRNDNLLDHGINFFIIALNVPRLIYTQQGEHLKRTITAVRDRSLPGERLYIRTDETTAVVERPIRW